jgi:hypothetical protein
MRLLRTLTLLVAACAALPGAAAAKGIPGERITEIAPAPPAGLVAGEPWRMSVTIRDHRGNFVPGPPPRLSAQNLGTGETREASAHPTRTKGVWTFAIRFPDAGPWRYEVEDGWGKSQSWPVIQVAAAPARSDSRGAGLGWIAGAGAVLAAGILAARRYSLSQSQTPSESDSVSASSS